MTSYTLKMSTKISYVKPVKRICNESVKIDGLHHFSFEKTTHYIITHEQCIHNIMNIIQSYTIYIFFCANDVISISVYHLIARVLESTCI